MDLGVMVVAGFVEFGFGEWLEEVLVGRLVAGGSVEAVGSLIVGRVLDGGDREYILALPLNFINDLVHVRSAIHNIK